MNIMNQIHTLHSGNKTIALRERDSSWYVLGFRSMYTARNVHYKLPPEPKMRLSRSHMTLTIQKSPLINANIIDPIQDVGYHMQSILYRDFAVLPFTKGLGIVLIHGDPMDEEDEHRFLFTNVQIVDPVVDTDAFRQSLS